MMQNDFRFQEAGRDHVRRVDIDWLVDSSFLRFRCGMKEFGEAVQRRRDPDDNGDRRDFVAAEQKSLHDRVRFLGFSPFTRSSFRVLRLRRNATSIPCSAANRSAFSRNALRNGSANLG
jgi:hypothetical protein